MCRIRLPYECGLHPSRAPPGQISLPAIHTSSADAGQILLAAHFVSRTQTNSYFMPQVLMLLFQCTSLIRKPLQLE